MSARKAGGLRKALIVLGAFLGILVLTAVIVPLVVDVDKYRPEIVKAANERLNGKLELGKLSLSLWGQVRIEVAGVNLADAQGRRVVAVKDAFFHLPFSSLLSGAPLLTFKMQNPEVDVVKDKAGKLNVMSLMKPSASAPGAPQTPAAGQPPAGGGGAPGVSLPGIAARARLGIELRNALVTYVDEKTDLKTRVKDLNLVVRDLSLTRPTELELWADLDTKVGESLTVRGPARITGHGQSEVSQGKLEQLGFTLKAAFDDLEILMPGLFEKKKGVPANADIALKLSGEEARIERFDVKFFNADLKATGNVSNLSAKPGAPAASPVVNVAFHSNEIPLKPWAELLPMLKAYELGGSASLDGAVNGPSDKLGYRASMALKGATAKAPHLKAAPELNGLVKVVTDQIESFNFTLKAPGNDLRMSGKLVSFTRPRLEAEIDSSGLDLDQLVDFPPPGKAKTTAAAPMAPPAGEAGAPGAATGGAAKAAGSDYDALLAPLRANKIAVATTGDIKLAMKSVQAYGVKMTDLNGHFSLNDLVAGIERFGMKLWGGAITASGTADLKPAAPAYRFASSVNGLELQQAVASQLQLFKNTVLGKAQFKIDGAGSSFNPEAAKKNLNAKGNLKVEKASFATIDVVRMASEAVNKAIGHIAEKIPQLKGKTVPVTAGGKESRYDWISSTFTIAGGKFSAPDFATQAEKDSGIDLKGATSVGLLDDSLKADWLIVDTFNLTKAADVSVEQAGVKVDHLLSDGGKGPVKFPVSAGCTILAPCYSYTQVPEFLATVALSNVTHAATGKAKAEMQKQLAEQAKKLEEQAPPQVKNALQGLTKKFFGH